MKQITSAVDVITKLRSSRIPRDAHGVTFALYAPGDSTLYRVSLITMWPVEEESALPAQTCLLVVMDGDTITILKPQGAHVEWTPERFTAKFSQRRIGWWPAVRPLLAALKWTPKSDRSTDFTVIDWARITDLTR